MLSRTPESHAKPGRRRTPHHGPTTVQLIAHLEEIQTRRLHLEMGYSSMWEFCTTFLGLSEGAAQRRIAAMRLAKDAPEAKVALQSGKLSLSNAAKIQSFRQNQKRRGLAPANPHELIQKIENLSQRECEARLFEISPESVPQERERVVSATQEREIKLVITAELHEKIQRLKGLLAHSMPDATYAELIEYMTNEALGRLEKKKGITRAQDSDQAQDPSPNPKSTAAAAVKNRLPQAHLPFGKRIHLPVALQRATFGRAQGRCEFTHQGKRCSSRYRLQIDHRIPLAGGGGHQLKNLRVLCQAHNLQQFAAWEQKTWRRNRYSVE